MFGWQCRLAYRFPYFACASAPGDAFNTLPSLKRTVIAAFVALNAR